MTYSLNKFGQDVGRTVQNYATPVAKVMTDPLHGVPQLGSNIVQTGKTLGGQIADNKGTIVGSMLGGGPGAILGAAIVDKKHGLIGQPLAKGISHVGDVLTGLAPKVGLGQYKPDESAYGQSQSAQDMAKAAAAGQSASSGRAAVTSPIVYRPATASSVDLGAGGTTQVASVDPAQQEQWRAQQLGLAQQLTDQGNGIGPSLAQSQLQQGRDLNIANAMALGASQRGLTAGQGLRNIADQTVNANQQAAQQAATLRLQEQLSARDQLSGVLSGARSQDIGLATTNAGFAQQGALQDSGFRQNAAMQNAAGLTSVAQSNAAGQLGAATATGSQALQQQAQNDAMVRAYMEQGTTLEVAKMKAAQDLEALKSSNYNANQQRISGILGGAGQAVATIATGK